MSDDIKKTAKLIKEGKGKWVSFTLAILIALAGSSVSYVVGNLGNKDYLWLFLGIYIILLLVAIGMLFVLKDGFGSWWIGYKMMYIWDVTYLIYMITVISVGLNKANDGLELFAISWQKKVIELGGKGGILTIVVQFVIMYVSLQQHCRLETGFSPVEEREKRKKEKEVSEAAVKQKHFTKEREKYTDELKQLVDEVKSVSSDMQKTIEEVSKIKSETEQSLPRGGGYGTTLPSLSGLSSDPLVQQTIDRVLSSPPTSLSTSSYTSASTLLPRPQYSQPRPRPPQQRGWSSVERSRGPFASSSRF